MHKIMRKCVSLFLAFSMVFGLIVGSPKMVYADLDQEIQTGIMETETIIATESETVSGLEMFSEQPETKDLLSATSALGTVEPELKQAPSGIVSDIHLSTDPHMVIYWFSSEISLSERYDYLLALWDASGLNNGEITAKVKIFTSGNSAELPFLGVFDASGTVAGYSVPGGIYVHSPLLESAATPFRVEVSGVPGYEDFWFGSLDSNVDKLVPPGLSTDKSSLSKYRGFSYNDYSNQFRAVWGYEYAGTIDPALEQYYKQIYEITVNDTKLNSLKNYPTNTKPGWYANNRVLAISLDPYYGYFEVVIRANGYEDQILIFDNQERDIVLADLSSFNLDLAYADGLVSAPESIEDNLRDWDSFAEYYRWTAPIYHTTGIYSPDVFWTGIASADRIHIRDYFAAITSVKAYTDNHPEGIALKQTAEEYMPFSMYSWHSGSTNAGAFGNLYVSTNLVIMSDDAATGVDKLNRLIIKATGYPDYDTDSTGGFNHSAKKLPIYLSPAFGIERSPLDPEDITKGYQLNDDVRVAFTPNAGFENSITGITIEYPDRDSGQVKRFALTSDDYAVGSGEIIVFRNVFTDPALPAMTDYSIIVHAANRFDSLCIQYIGSSNPFDDLKNVPAFILKFPGMEDRELTERDIYEFALTHRYFYSVDGKIVYDCACNNQYSADYLGLNATDLGENYYYNGIRKGQLHTDFLGIDVAHLYYHFMNKDFYSLAQDPNVPNYEIMLVAVDGWDCSVRMSDYRYETAYFKTYTSDGGKNPIPMPVHLITLEYDGGTHIRSAGLRWKDSESSNRFMLRKSVSIQLGTVSVQELGSKTKAGAPMLTHVGTDAVDGSDNLPAYPGAVFSFSNPDSTIYYSIAWDGAVPDDPVPSFRNVYNIFGHGFGKNGVVTTDGKNLFDRGGLATVKFMTDGDLMSDVVTYSFLVDKRQQTAVPQGLTGNAGFIYDTTVAMEYSADQEIWRPCNDIYTFVGGAGSYYVRYAENQEFYAGPATDPIIVSAAAKDPQDAPKGLRGLMPQAADQQGRIDGTTSAMEYSADSLSWLACAEGVTLVAAGASYFVRYAESDTHYAGSVISIFVPLFVEDFEGYVLEIIDRRDGGNLKYLFSPEQLAALTGSTKYTYSTVNTYGSFKNYSNAQGPEIQRLFESAGVGVIDGNELIKFVSSDGFEKTVSYGYLTAERYYFPLANSGNVASGQATGVSTLNPVKVPAIIDLTYSNGTIMLGQIHPNEQTNNAYVQFMAHYDMGRNRVGQIIITGETAGQFPAVKSATPDSGDCVNSGTTVTFNGWQTSLGFTDGYIYYTTNGNEPTLVSSLYNYNTYLGVGGAVFKPVIREGDADTNGKVTLKAKVFGKAKQPSETMVFNYYIEGMTVEPVVYTVTFDYNDGVRDAVEVTVAEGGSVEQPGGDPVLAGYVFLGWRLDGELFDFGTAVTGNITLTALWEEQTTNVTPPPEPVQPEPAPISISVVSGVKAPVTGETPVVYVAETQQFTGTVTWSGNPVTFAAGTVYTATITLTPKSDYTLDGVLANFFTVYGAKASNDAGAGVITAIFTATGNNLGSVGGGGGGGGGGGATGGGNNTGAVDKIVVKDNDVPLADIKDDDEKATLPDATPSDAGTPPDTGTLSGAGAPLSFADVQSSNWFYSDVLYVSSKGYMQGTGNGEFEPNLTLTRAMVVTVLYRLAGSPAVTSGHTFTDVSEDQWYSEAVQWGADNGVTQGYGNGYFGAFDDVTRQDIAVFVHRYAMATGAETASADGYNGFTDEADIAAYAAAEPIKWCVANGIINGRPDGSFGPQDNAVRAEFAAIIHRFMEQ